MSLQAINLGLPKSGTTTLARALRRAGLRVADYRIRKRQTDDPALQGAYVADLLYSGYFETGDPAARLAGFDAISETSKLNNDGSSWPQTDFALIRALRAHHPGLKLLATRRDSFTMSQSMLAWNNLGSERLPKGDIPGLPTGFGVTSAERTRWIDGHYQSLQDAFGTDPDFAMIDIDDPGAPSQVGALLGLDLPWWGRANTNPKSSDLPGI